MSVYLLFFGLSFAIAALFTPWVKKLAFKIRAVDVPKDDRRMHKVPIARLGGLAIYISFIVTLSIFFRLSGEILGLVLGGSILVVIGIVDDVYRLGPWLKLCFQVLAALVAFYFGIRVEYITNPFGGLLDFGVFSVSFLGQTVAFVSLFITVMWLIIMVNTVNFLDGLDGLAGGVAFIGSIILFALSLLPDVNQPVSAGLAIILAGACLGFLVYNFYPARIFMGDSGAYFIGFVMASLAVISGAKLATAVLVMGFPLLDLVWAVLRRLKNRVSPFTADRAHLHHRLVDAGLTVRQAVFLLYVFSATFGVVAILGRSVVKFFALLGLFGTMLVLSTYLVYRGRRN